MKTISWNTTSCYCMLRTTLLVCVHVRACVCVKRYSVAKTCWNTKAYLEHKALTFRRHDVVSLHRRFVGEPISSFTSWPVLGKWESKLNWAWMLFPSYFETSLGAFFPLIGIIKFLYAKIPVINKTTHNEICHVNQPDTNSNQIMNPENTHH